MAAILKAWRHILDLTPLIGASLLEEHTCQISSQYDWNDSDLDFLNSVALARTTKQVTIWDQFLIQNWSLEQCACVCTVTSTRFWRVKTHVTGSSCGKEGHQCRQRQIDNHYSTAWRRQASYIISNKHPPVCWLLLLSVLLWQPHHNSWDGHQLSAIDQIQTLRPVFLIDRSMQRRAQPLNVGGI